MAKIDPIILVIRKYRQRRGLSQKELADMAGISLRTLQRVETGTGDIKLSQYRQLTTSLQITDLEVALAQLKHGGTVVGHELVNLVSELPVDLQRSLIRFLSEVIDKIKPH